MATNRQLRQRADTARARDLSLDAFLERARGPRGRGFAGAPAEAWQLATQPPDRVPGARCYNSANISVPNGTDTALSFDTETYDNGGLHSTSVNPSRLTFTQPGYYFLAAACKFATNATGLRIAFLLLNGSARLLETSQIPTSADVVRLHLSTVCRLAAADYVQLFVYQTSGGALNVNTSETHTPLLAAQLLWT